MSTVATRRGRGGGAEPRLRTIGSVCEELREQFPDISVSKIRYLEEQGLISPRRTRGGYRLFAPDDIERLTTILRLQRDEFLPLRVIREERLIERSRNVAAILLAGLKRIKERADRLKEVRARGLMLALELADDSETSFTARTHRELVRRGFVLGRRPGVSVLRLDPSLTVDRKDIEDFLGTLEDVLTST